MMDDMENRLSKNIKIIDFNLTFISKKKIMTFKRQNLFLISLFLQSILYILHMILSISKCNKYNDENNYYYIRILK